MNRTGNRATLETVKDGNLISRRVEETIGVLVLASQALTLIEDKINGPSVQPEGGKAVQSVVGLLSMTLEMYERATAINDRIREIAKQL